MSSIGDWFSPSSTPLPPLPPAVSVTPPEPVVVQAPAPKPAAVQPIPPMPDTTLQIRREAERRAMQRAGRTSTILSTPQSRGGTGNTDYTGARLGNG